MQNNTETEEKPIISVIMPVYNAEKYLQMTLESVKNQTFTNFELVCVNDGSDDNSAEILKTAAKDDKRIKVFSQKNSGGSASRNKGLDLALGQYIAFLDNDDIYHPQYLEILYKNITESGADVSCCSYLRFNGDEKYEFEKTNIKPHFDFVSAEPFKDKFERKKKIETLMWAKLYKKSLFDEVRFAESLPAINDILLNIEILLHAKKIVVCKEKLIAYRIISTSQTMKPLSFARIEEYKNLPVEINILSEQFPQYKGILQKLASRYAYGMCVKEYMQRCNPEDDAQNYAKITENLQYLLANKYIKYADLSLRKRLILWSFLRGKFRLLKWIKE